MGTTAITSGYEGGTVMTEAVADGVHDIPTKTPPSPSLHPITSIQTRQERRAKSDRKPTAKTAAGKTSQNGEPLVFGPGTNQETG